MTEGRRDVALVDAVFGYCALHGIQPDDPHLANMLFPQVMRELQELCTNNMPYVMISWELRQVAPICHAECHIESIRQFFAENPDWGRGDGKGKAAVDNVIPFPTSSTRH